MTIHLQEPIPYSKLSSLQQTQEVARLPFWESVGRGDKSGVARGTRPVGEEEVEGLGGLGWVVVEVDCHTAEPVALWCLEWAIRNHCIADLQQSLSICSHCSLKHMELDHVFIPSSSPPSGCRGNTPPNGVITKDSDRIQQTSSRTDSWAGYEGRQLWRAKGWRTYEGGE